MKTRFGAVALVIVVIATLSFSFTNLASEKTDKKSLQANTRSSEPVGGFVIEEGF